MSRLRRKEREEEGEKEREGERELKAVYERKRNVQGNWD